MAKPALPKDPKQLTNAEFQQFCQHIPHEWLKSRGIARSSFLAVSFMLSRHGKFENGEDVRVSQAALVDESGCSHNTVRKVIAFLKEIKALEFVDHQRRAGRSSENFRFRRSYDVQLVLENKNRGPKPPSTKKKRGVSVDTLTERVDTSTERVDTSTAPVDNNKVYNINRKVSVASAPSPSPLALRAESSEKKNLEDDVWLNNISTDGLDDLLNEVGL